MVMIAILALAELIENEDCSFFIKLVDLTCCLLNTSFRLRLLFRQSIETKLMNKYLRDMQNHINTVL